MQTDKIKLTEEEKSKIIKDADNMLKGIYYFDGVWDMEVCNIPVNNKKIKWNITYNGDPEWTYMFTRMNYLYKLIIAYKITQQKQYINHGLRIINKWYKDNKKFFSKIFSRISKHIYKNNYAHRTLDISILATNIIDYIIYCHEKKYNERERIQ